MSSSAALSSKPQTDRDRVPLLIKFDRLLFDAIDEERIHSATGVRRDGRPKLPVRTDMIRELLREAIDERKRRRGEECPSMQPLQ